MGKVKSFTLFHNLLKQKKEMQLIGENKNQKQVLVKKIRFACISPEKQNVNIMGLFLSYQ